MARLQYKTRGQSNPQGKPKVYFCCHPKDFNIYFNNISEDILKIHNCSIWYDVEPEKADDEELFFSGLSQMQLFVMPVTRNLLFTENRAINKEFDFAIKNHIPILPLMQEPDLEGIFNKKCGDLQFLDKNSRDTTAISYEEKFKKYLDSVLVGDELAEKIRESFDAYVFLSYRKKDRKYAQKLMQLIHKNKFCRDIAIWYDEFLTPGENFNDAIKAALQKSELFAMVVTPNLVNEKNYVMTIEYPMAKDANKPILSAEMEDTDRHSLEKQFAEIGEITDAYDEIALSDALLENFKQLAIRGNDDSPEHNFFIGLAYLSGIDVEKDSEKAVELITFAAENNVPQAVEKLVAMYTNGEGVARDNQQVIKWKTKYIDVCEEIYKESKTAADCEKWLTAKFELVMFISGIGRYMEAIEKYEELAEFCGDKLMYLYLIDDGINVEERDTFAAVYNRTQSLSLGSVGEIYKGFGDFEKAKKYLYKSLAISEELCEKWDNIWFLRDVSTGYSTLGEICFLERNLDDAERHYMDSLKYKEILAKESEDSLFVLDLVCIYENISSLYKMKGDVDKALEYMLKGTDIAKVLVKEFDEISNTYVYCKEKILLSDIYKMKSDMDPALKELFQVLEIIENFESKYHDDMIYLKGLCNLKISQIYAVLGINDKVLHYIEIAVNLLEGHLGNTDYIVSKDVLVGAYAVYSQIMMHRENINVAIEYCQKSISIIDEFLENGINIHINDYLVVYSTIACCYIQNQQTEKAKEYLNKAEYLINKYDIKPDSIVSLSPFLLFYLNLADIYLGEDNDEKALEYYMKTLEVYNQLKIEWPIITKEMKLYLVYFNIACLLEDKDIRKAVEYFLLCIEEIESMTEEEKNLDVYDCLCLSCYEMYGLSGILKRKKWKRKCEEVWGVMCYKYGEECYSTSSAELFRIE